MRIELEKRAGVSRLFTLLSPLLALVLTLLVGAVMFAMLGKNPLDATSVYRSETFLAAKPDNVHVLAHGGIVRVAAGVALVAAPWTSKKPETDLMRVLLGERLERQAVDLYNVLRGVSGGKKKKKDPKPSKAPGEATSLAPLPGQEAPASPAGEQ